MCNSILYPAPPRAARPPSRLDPNLPWFITDHFWFWRKGVNSGPVHPAFDAPRCVPCGFNKTGLDLGALGFDPPPACPYCSKELLCPADTRHALYNQDCSLNLLYPNVGRAGVGRVLFGISQQWQQIPTAHLARAVQQWLGGLAGAACTGGLGALMGNCRGWCTATSTGWLRLLSLSEQQRAALCVRCRRMASTWPMVGEASS